MLFTGRLLFIIDRHLFKKVYYWTDPTQPMDGPDPCINLATSLRSRHLMAQSIVTVSNLHTFRSVAYWTQKTIG